jgi:hypothetical protein
MDIKLDIKHQHILNREQFVDANFRPKIKIIKAIVLVDAHFRPKIKITKAIILDEYQCRGHNPSQLQQLWSSGSREVECGHLQGRYGSACSNLQQRINLIYMNMNSK